MPQPFRFTLICITLQVQAVPVLTTLISFTHTLLTQHEFVLKSFTLNAIFIPQLNATAQVTKLNATAQVAMLNATVLVTRLNVLPPPI